MFSWQYRQTSCWIWNTIWKSEPLDKYWDISEYLRISWDIPGISFFPKTCVRNIPHLSYLWKIHFEISVNYLASKTNILGLGGWLKIYQGYPIMSHRYHSLLQQVFLAATLSFLLVSDDPAWHGQWRPCMARLAPSGPSCSTVIHLSSVSATDRHPTLGLQRPNCNSSAFS